MKKGIKYVGGNYCRANLFLNPRRVVFGNRKDFGEELRIYLLHQLREIYCNKMRS